MNTKLTRGELPIWFELFKAALTGTSANQRHEDAVRIAAQIADLAFEEYRKYQPPPRISEEQLRTVDAAMRKAAAKIES